MSANVSPARPVLTPSKMNQQHPSPAKSANGATPNNSAGAAYPAAAAGLSPWGHTLDCACQTCQYYAAANMYMMEFATPYALAQQYAFMSAMAAPGTPSPFAAGGSPVGAQAPAPSASPASPSARPNAAATTDAPTPLRRLDFGNEEAIEDAIAEADDLVAFACSSRGRDYAIAAINQGGRGAEQLKAALLPQFMSLSSDALCVHVLRALLERLAPAETERVIADFAEADARQTLNLATTSQHTRKILEHLLDHRESEHVAALEQTLVKNTLYLGLLQQGCIALMHLVKISQARRVEILHAVKQQSNALSQDQYGNYVFQALIEYCDEAQVVDLLKVLKGTIGSLATNKYASNVLEKAIKSPLHAVRRVIVAELVFHTEATLRTAVHDKYGNFVVQVALGTTTSVAEHRRISERVRAVINGSPYASRIEQKMKQRRAPAPPSAAVNQLLEAQAATNSSVTPARQMNRQAA